MADEKTEKTIVTEYDEPAEGEMEPTDARMGEFAEEE